MASVPPPYTAGPPSDNDEIQSSRGVPSKFTFPWPIRLFGVLLVIGGIAALVLWGTTDFFDDVENGTGPFSDQTGTARVNV